MPLTPFNIYLCVMIVIAVATFITLYFVDAGYGIFRTEKWGRTISNRWAWFFMELPIFLAMSILWLTCSSTHNWGIVPLVFLIIFQTHYIQRTLIFPFLLKGKGRMPIGIMCMGISFNVLNAMMQGYWLFYEAYQKPQAMFVELGTDWFYNWRFILGICLFIAGYVINLRSDYIIRHLRKNPEDTKHYFPKGFMFNYVTSANYFGELLEWSGFAILTWSIPGLVFFIWTFANLAPRAHAIHKRYQMEFPEEMKNRKLKRLIPFIY